MLSPVTRSLKCSAGLIGPAHSYVCRHLASGASGLGLYYDIESRTAWPDLRCDDCRTEERSRRTMRPVCGFCWDDAFGRNTKILSANAGVFLSESFRRGHDRHHRWSDRYDIGRLTRWVLDLEGKRPLLGLGRPHQERLDLVCAPIVLGTWSAQGPEWLWGWANESLRASHFRGLVRVKRFGELCGMEPLWRSRIDGEETLALHLTMVAIDAIHGCEGVYRVVQQNGTSIFLGVRETRRVEG